MIFRFIGDMANKHGFEHLLTTDDLEGRLFWVVTQYLFHDFYTVRSTYKAAEMQFRVALDNAGFEPDPLNHVTASTVASDVIGIMSRHYELNIHFRAVVAMILLDYTDDEILAEHPQYAEELADIVELIEGSKYDPPITDEKLNLLVDYRLCSFEYDKQISYVYQHSITKLIPRKARFIMDTFQWRASDLTNEILDKSIQTFYRCLVTANDMAHVESSVYSAMHAGLKNMIVKYTSEKGGRLKGRKALTKDEARYVKGYTEKDLINSHRPECLMLELRFSDCFNTDEGEEALFNRMATDFVRDEAQRDAKLSVEQFKEHYDLLDKQLEFLNLMSGTFCERFSAFLTMDRARKLNTDPEPISNDVLFDRAQKTGQYARYIAKCAEFLQVPLEAVKSFMLLLRDFMSGNIPLDTAA